LTPAQKYESEEDAKTIEERTFFWSRVIRPNIKEEGHVITDLCTPEGEFDRRIIAKSHKFEGGYNLSRKIKWGDLWRYHKRIPHKFRKAGLWGKRLW
jgi:ribosomal protein RSM22 (predicted rRNA methylase)